MCKSVYSLLVFVWKGGGNKNIYSYLVYVQETQGDHTKINNSGYLE